MLGYTLFIEGRVIDMFTNRAKALVGVVAGVAIVGGLAYGQVQNTKEIAKIENQAPIVVTKTVVVTPTNVPTATPAASLRIPLRASSASATKGVSK